LDPLDKVLSFSNKAIDTTESSIQDALVQLHVVEPAPHGQAIDPPVAITPRVTPSTTTVEHVESTEGDPELSILARLLHKLTRYSAKDDVDLSYAFSELKKDAKAALKHMEQVLKSRTENIAILEKEKALMMDVVNETSKKLESFQEGFDAMLKKEFDDAVNKLEAAHQDHMEHALQESAEFMLRHWHREIQLQVEEERADRLGQLEQVWLQLMLLKGKTEADLDMAKRILRLNQVQRAVNTFKQAVLVSQASPIQDKKPFLKELEHLQHVSASTEEFSVVDAVSHNVHAQVAYTGLPSDTDLLERYKDVRDQVRKAALVPDNGGFVSHLISRLFSKLLFTTSAWSTDKDVESILGRADVYVQGNDFELAARELNQLTGWNELLVKDWIDSARRTLEIKQAIQAMEAECFVVSTAYN
jgi:mitofilin